jgi:hypothetical protein
MRCFIVIGGREYYGPTAERDASIVQRLARRLFEHYGNTIRIVTAGTDGIPDDFCTAWKQAGGKHICWVKMSDEELFLDVLGDMKHVICAIAVQGGKGTAEKLQKLEQKGVPIVSFWGSGGAAGGKISFGEYTFQKKIPGALCFTDPWSNVNDITEEFFNQVYARSTDYLPLEQLVDRYYYMGILEKVCDGK